VFTRSPAFGRSPANKLSAIVFRSGGGSTLFANSESISLTFLFSTPSDQPTASITAPDAGGSAGLIVGIIIGAVAVISVVILFLVFQRKCWRKNSDRTSESEDTLTGNIQFVNDTATNTTDETFVSYQDSFTYEGGSLGSNSFPTPLSRDPIHVALL
jgi:hypothetical protein